MLEEETPIPSNSDNHETDSKGSPRSSVEETAETAKLLPAAAAAKETRLTLYVILLSAVSTIGGFLFGYDTGVVSGALIKLKDDFHLTPGEEEWIVGIAVGAAAVGALLAGFLSNNLGRKPTLITSSVLFTCGSVLLFTAKNFATLLVGRTVLGLGVGVASMVIPAYLAESSPPEYRGRLVTAFGATITSGQFIASVVDGLFSGVYEGWRWMLGIAVFPSVIMGVGMIVLPESPRYMVQRGRMKEAEETFQRISGRDDVTEELREVRETLAAETEYSSHGILHMVREISRNGPVKRALAIGCALQAFQQLGGINTVMYYSTTMIKMAGVRSDAVAIWLSCIPSFCNALFALVSMAIIEKFPRRRLLLSTLLGTIIGLVLLGAAYYSISQTTAPVSPLNNTCSNDISNCDQCVSVDSCSFCAPTKEAEGRCITPTADDNCTTPGFYYVYDVCYSPYSFAIIVAMVFYIAMFATGIGTLAWTINSEIYPMWVRGYALSLSTLTNWSFNLLIAFTFLDLTKAITKYGAFWLYAGVTGIGWLLFYLRLPETRGVPLERVEQLFL